MPIYSSGRRRTIIVLLLTSIMLITIDLRGNALLDAARSGFDYAFRPFEVAADVVSTPIERAWHGITRVDDLERENAELRRRIDQMQSDSLAGQNAMIQNRQLRAILGLTSLASYEKATCSTIGASPSNQDQTVEIDCGSLDGLKVGMPVINDAGLVGKVHKTNPETAVVMLATDPSFRVAVKVVGERLPDPTPPVDSTPSGIPADSIGSIADEMNATTTSTTTTTVAALQPGDTVPSADSSADTTGSSAPPSTPDSTPVSTPDSAPTSTPDSTPGAATAPGTTTTTTVPLVMRETGMLEGYGAGFLPRVRLIADSPQFGRPQVGDAVLTSGGGATLYPPDLPIGRVANVISVGGTVGLELEVEPLADLSQLDFLTIILFQPSTELQR